jgi:hypothetical protein
MFDKTHLDYLACLGDEPEDFNDFKAEVSARGDDLMIWLNTGRV